jgi:hypothetical protein
VISICVGLFFRLFGSALPIATVECSAGTVSGMTSWSNRSELLPEVHNKDHGKYRVVSSALPIETIGVVAIKDTSAGTVSSVDLYVGPAHSYSIGPDIGSL